MDKPKPMSEERLAEIEAREKKAEPGEWQWLHGKIIRDNDNDGYLVVCEGLESWAHKKRRAESERNANNGQFIAHSRTDVPDLLTEVRRLRAELAPYLDLAKEASNDDEPELNTMKQCWIGWRDRTTNRHKRLAALHKEAADG